MAYYNDSEDEFKALLDCIPVVRLSGVPQTYARFSVASITLAAPCCSTPPPPFEEAPPRTSRTNSSSTTSSSASRRRGASSASVMTTSSASSLALTPAALSSARSNEASVCWTPPASVEGSTPTWTEGTPSFTESSSSEQGYPMTPGRGGTPIEGRRSPRPAPPPRATPINCLTTEVVSDEPSRDGLSQVPSLAGDVLVMHPEPELSRPFSENSSSSLQQDSIKKPTGDFALVLDWL
ncbi:unnamed protein product [Pieris macdunnoughi]|uniref:Uncharacterized protein n=1 Tax=Pieris macdunnoughi TaxID=345717 RepID=A0A821KVK8_9NEOP|nr:unnamed protein product [Pieris macdunnoughi]